MIRHFFDENGRKFFFDDREKFSLSKCCFLSRKKTKQECKFETKKKRTSNNNYFFPPGTRTKERKDIFFDDDDKNFVFKDIYIYFPSELHKEKKKL
jgi:hypothetical protein